MPVIYHVLLKHIKDKKSFQVTWSHAKTNSQDCFSSHVEITEEETRKFWQTPDNQLEIGTKIFRFLDGDSRHFVRALDDANKQGEILQIYLWTCLECADWPFEILANEGEFLLLSKMHLVRCVSHWGKDKTMRPQNRPLKFLFIASSPLGVKPELDYEEEEDAIYKTTENLPIEMTVEDSGSLKGLRERLENEEYDVIQLSGHADITSDGTPFFIMEDELGKRQDVSPDDLWDEALIENIPRLLFLSGCRTGEALTNDESMHAVSFAHLLVKNHNIPTVLGWGRKVSDTEAIEAEKHFFHELSRGKSILETVQRIRYELFENIPGTKKNAWSLLRLFCNGIELNSIVKKGQRQMPKPKRLITTYLRNSSVKILSEGFIGRRRQMQRILYTFNQLHEKIGVLILGGAGLGKSCLAAKTCERFKDHTPIIVSGPLNSFSLEKALKEAFIISGDKKGVSILSGKNEMKEKLKHLCADSFKKHRYLILLDGFDQNIDGADKGQPDRLTLESASLLNVLLHYLPCCGKMTQLVVTSRYGFSLTENNCDLVEKRLERITLTTFREPEQIKKTELLTNIMDYNYGLSALVFMREGKGNPLLMEGLDILVGRMLSEEKPKILEAITKEREVFIQENGLLALVKGGSKDLENFLRSLSVFYQPVLILDIRRKAEENGFENWEKLLAEGIRLSLIEYDQASEKYQLMPLLKEILLPVN